MSVDIKKTGLIVGVAVNTGLVAFGATCGALPSSQVYIEAVKTLPLNCYSKGLDQAEPQAPYSSPNSLLSANLSMSAVGTATVYGGLGTSMLGKI